ncbi:hypothetical protein GIB67_024910 [Kingdonia uniflora]|uniref:Uncharacterized protein n=1 Tax=Kingdonia uniflora TaxID=39325 RepID=A0A7J7NZD1_9MAGN|nr:hypothetical protein GIB67_024910 [Kingdonia uniflora]
MLNSCLVHLYQIELIDSISHPRRACIFDELCCKSHVKVELSISISDRNEIY